MSSNEERRQAAKAKLEQRLELEQAQSRKRKIIIASVSTAVVVAIVATVTTIVVKKILDDREAARWTTCEYAKAQDPFANIPTQVPPNVPADQRETYQKQIDEMQAQVKVARPLERISPQPGNKQLKAGTADWKLNTNLGTIGVKLDRTGAPCNTDAIISLTQNKATLKTDPKVTFNSFFDKTACHRMVTSKSLQVLQCGDPTSLGAGSPGWTSPDEQPTDLKPGPTQDPSGNSAQIVIYPRGTVAIANQAQQPNSGSSQFFLVINDSQLPANYAVVGKVDEAGLAILDKVYKGGITPTSAERAEDGKPKTAIDIQTATVETSDD